MRYRYGLLSLAIAASLLPATVMAAPSDQKFNEKFTFTNVTFSDGTVGEIRAGSKITGGRSQFTVCSYFSQGGVDYLGRFESSTFASNDPVAVEQFCLAQYTDRQA